MRAENLTDRQHEVLEHIRRRGMPPSRRELAQSLGLGFASAVNYHLRALERKRWIELTPGMDRGISYLREGTPVFDPDQLPPVTAGTPTLADESKAIMRGPGRTGPPSPSAGGLLSRGTRRQHVLGGLPLRGHHRGEAHPAPIQKATSWWRGSAAISR